MAGRSADAIWAQPGASVVRGCNLSSARLFIASTASIRVRNLTTEIHLGHEGGLRKPSVANSDVLIAVAKSFVRDRTGSLGCAKMLYVDVAIHFALGLDD